MFLRPVQRPSQATLESLRPKQGDTVIFEGSEYLVLSAGLKYLKVVAVGTGSPGLVRVEDCYKVVPKEPGEPQHLENLDTREEEFED